jgi:hypothetical protein
VSGAILAFPGHRCRPTYVAVQDHLMREMLAAIREIEATVAGQPAAEVVQIPRAPRAIARPVPRLAKPAPTSRSRTVTA